MSSTISNFIDKINKNIDKVLNRILLWFKIDPTERSIPLAKKTFFTMVSLNTILLFAPLVSWFLIDFFNFLGSFLGDWFFIILSPIYNLLNSFLAPYNMVFSYGYFFEGSIAFIIVPIAFILNVKMLISLRKEGIRILDTIKIYLIISTISGGAALISISSIQYNNVSNVIFVLLVFGLNIVFLGPSLAGFCIPIYHFIHDILRYIFTGDFWIFAPALAIIISFLAITLFNTALFRFVKLLQEDVEISNNE